MSAVAGKRRGLTHRLDPGLQHAARARLGTAWVLATVLMAVACAPAAGPDPAGDLEAAIQEYVQRTRSETGHADLSAAAFQDRIAQDRALLARLEAVVPDSLTRAQRIDRVALIGVLDTDVRLAEARRPWANEPWLYLPAERIGQALEAVRVGDPGAREQLQGVLAGVPASVQQGMANLERPPRRFTEAALFQAQQTAASLQPPGLPPGVQQAGQPHANDGDGAVAGAGSETRGGSLAEALRAAREAVAAWQQYLREELLPRSDGDWRLGAEHYNEVLQRRWFLDADADAILARGREAFAQTEAEAQQVAERIEPGSSWVQVYEHLKQDTPPADGIKQAYQRAMDQARQFVHEHHVVTLPEQEHVITVDTPPAMRRSSPFGTFDTVDPFDKGLEGRLVLTPIEPTLSPEEQAQRLRSHHRAWIPIIAVHEAYPGHHSHAILARSNPRVLRRVLQEPIALEGWGLFTEQLMYELGFLQGDAVRLTILRNRLWRAARVILDVSLHTGRMSIDEAVDFLVQRVRFERYAAELEVAMYPRRPTYVLGYLIGMQEIDRLRRDWVQANGEPDPPAVLWDQVLSAGGVPPALVRAELLGGPIPGE